MVWRRTGRRMDNFARVFPKPPGRLHADIDIAIGNTGDQQASFMLEHIARSRSPLFFHFTLQKGVLLFKPGPVLFLRHSGKGFLHLFFRQKTTVIGDAGSNGLAKVCRIFRHLLYLIPGLLHRRQQSDHAGKRIQSLSAADTVIRRRIVMENNGHPFFRIGLVRKQGPFFYFIRIFFNSFGNRRIINPAVFPVFFGGKGQFMNHPVKLRFYYVTGKLHRIHADVRVPPTLVIPQQVIALQYRHI